MFLELKIKNNKYNIINCNKKTSDDIEIQGHQNKNKFVAIDGIGSIDDITHRIFSAIDPHL